MSKKKELKYPVNCPTKACYGYGFYWLHPEVVKRGNIDYFPVTKQGAEHRPKTIPCPACGANPFPDGRT